MNLKLCFKCLTSVSVIGISLEKFRAEVIFIIQVKVNSACLHFRSQQQAYTLCSAYNFKTKSGI